MPFISLNFNIYLQQNTIYLELNFYASQKDFKHMLIVMVEQFWRSA